MLQLSVEEGQNDYDALLNANCYKFADIILVLELSECLLKYLYMCSEFGIKLLFETSNRCIFRITFGKNEVSFI